MLGQKISIARIEAMAKHCRNRGGDCTCKPGECEPVRLARLRIKSFESESRRLQQTIDRLTQPPAETAKGWKLPDAPDCPGCEVPTAMRAGAYFDCGEADLHWFCDECGEVVWEPEIHWPFPDSDRCYADDFERAGFVCF